LRAFQEFETENAIGRLATLSDTTEKRFERIDIRLNAMDAHRESMDKRLERVENILTQILVRLPEKL
jgi:chaperonin cofactor prefoldin